MANEPPFRMAKSKALSNVVEGDVIVYKPINKRDQIVNKPESRDKKSRDKKSKDEKEWQRGIVYTIPRISLSAPPSGWRILPIDTIAKLRSPSVPEEFSFLEVTGEKVRQVGGNPDMQKAVVTFNIKSVVNAEEMTGFPKTEVWTLGSYAGTDLMVELIASVERLYHLRRLYLDGNKVAPTTKIYIVPAAAAQKKLEERKAKLKLDREKPPIPAALQALPIKEKWNAQVSVMTLKDAFESGYISERTLSFLGDAKTEDGRKPSTLVEAYQIVTKVLASTGKEDDPFANVPGLKNRDGVIRKDIIQQVTEAMSLLKPPSNEGGPA